RSGDAVSRENVRREAVGPPAVDKDLTRVRRQVSGEQVDECRLSGTVGPDQSDEIALGHGELDRIHRHDTAERLLGHPPPHQGTPLRHTRDPSRPTSLGAVRAPRASPSRTNCCHTGVNRPLRAKRMVSNRRTPKITRRHMPNARRYSSRNSTTTAPPTAVGIRSMPPITVITTIKAIRSRSPRSGVSTTL